MRAARILLIIGCALFYLTAVGVAQRLGGDPKAKLLKNPVAYNAASITAGRAVYAKNCRHCHGLRGKGDGPLAPKDPKPANLTDATWDHGSSDGELYAIILNGASPRPTQKESEMKPMKGTLTPTQIWQVVNYIRSIGPHPPPVK
jgi:mono/diheme cytochrome c family protein